MPAQAVLISKLLSGMSVGGHHAYDHCLGGDDGAS